MKSVKIYTSKICGYCNWAKDMLKTKDVEFEEIRIDLDQEQAADMVKKAGGMTSVPQIFIGDLHIGGYTDMVALDKRGELDPLLENTSTT